LKYIIIENTFITAVINVLILLLNKQIKKIFEEEECIGNTSKLKVIEPVK
jgi:hypothetical protein